MHRVLALIVVLGTSAALSSPALAIPVFYDDEATWLANMDSVALEDLNTQTGGDAFHTAPLDVGVFTFSMTGTPSSAPGRNQIDVPPPQFSQYDVDGSTIANVLITSDDSFFLTFDTPVTGFGVDLASLNDEQIRTSIHVAGGSNTPEIMGEFLEQRFFGVISNTAFTSVEFRGLDNDGFGLDNVQFGAAVPEPGNMTLVGSGLIGLVMWRRFRR